MYSVSKFKPAWWLTNAHFQTKIHNFLGILDVLGQYAAKGWKHVHKLNLSTIKFRR